MHQFDLKNRTAIITGGAQGFGFDIAKKFLNSGANVIIWDIDEKQLKNATKKINSPKLSYNVVDISNFEKVNNTVNEINKSSKIDILINNAGITGPIAELWNYSAKDWNNVIEINLNGTFNCCKSVVPNMIKNNYGRIVNIASIAGKEGNPNAVPYSATKSAVIGLTKSLGKELAKTEIRVNCVTPAVVKTSILDEFTEEHINYMLEKIPIGRTGKIEEVANMVAWIASEECSFSTGAVFDISGGRATY